VTKAEGKDAKKGERSERDVPLRSFTIGGGLTLPGVKTLVSLLEVETISGINKKERGQDLRRTEEDLVHEGE